MNSMTWFNYLFLFFSESFVLGLLCDVLTLPDFDTLSSLRLLLHIKKETQTFKWHAHALLFYFYLFFLNQHPFQMNFIKRLSKLTVLCCCPAPVLCAETVRVLSHPVCSPLLLPVDPLAGCRYTTLMDTWHETEAKGETLMLAPDLLLTPPDTGSGPKQPKSTHFVFKQMRNIFIVSVCQQNAIFMFKS